MAGRESGLARSLLSVLPSAHHPAFYVLAGVALAEVARAVARACARPVPVGAAPPSAADAAAEAASGLPGTPLAGALLPSPRPCPLCAAPAGGAGGASITLAGGGPGSLELLTLAAYQALQCADVVISDLIAPPALRAAAPAHAEFHVADKVPGNADSAQSSVNGLGLAALQRGKRVVRLKVGDPYLYGRGGEEVAFYRAHGFEPRVIPGVCTALAAPCAAGIPVTHRGAANQVLLSTGQGRGGSFPDLPPFDATRTLVLLMAVGRIPLLRADLCEQRAYPEHTPVAIIERATHPTQRITRTTLADLARDAGAADVQSPAVLVIGSVCSALEQPEQPLSPIAGDS